MMKPREQAQFQALQRAWEDLRSLDPLVVSFCSDADYEREAPRGILRLRFWDKRYEVNIPESIVREEVTGEEPDIVTQLLILHYLIKADGTPMADQWITFRELPGGLAYNTAFLARTSVRLVRTYGYDLPGFIRAAESLGGERLVFGDASFMFRLFPRLRMAVILHRGDEEFPPEATVLFDGSAHCYLPLEDLAVLGGMLCSKLIKAGKNG